MGLNDLGNQRYAISERRAAVGGPAVRTACLPKDERRGLENASEGLSLGRGDDAASACTWELQEMMLCKSLKIA